MTTFGYTLRTWALACSALASLSLSGPGTAAAATLPSARLAFSSTSVGFNAVNPRPAGSTEIALIAFVAADGTTDLTVPVLVGSSNPLLLSVSKTAYANAAGNYVLSVPANAPAGTATVTASATVGGVVYTRARDFVITPSSVATPPPPPGVSTMARALTPTLNADQSGCATINYYDVGPAQPYSALGQLPWSQLKGCDTVRIFAKPNGAAYNEMMLISAGTNLAPTAPNKFMRVIGMPDAVTGARPVIDGSNATQWETLPNQAPRTLQYHDNGSPSRVLYQLGLVMVGPQRGYNYNFGPTGYVGIENLDIRNAALGQPFADAQAGTTAAYNSFAACLYVEAAAHLVVKNNLLHNCGNGLFINSKNSTLLELSQDVLIEGNQFFNNSNPPLAGVTNGFSEHHSYTEARDITFQFNTFGDVRPAAFGDCLKDRSSGLVVRYNTFASSCGILLNLMDSTGGQNLIWGDAGYAQTHVYGNLFDLTPVAGQGSNLVYYGGDSGTAANYRQGVFNFYNNTMVVKGDAGHGIYPETLLFNLVMPGAWAEVRNNIFQATPATPGAAGRVQAMAIGKGTVNLLNNWVSPNAAAYWAGHLSGAVVNGWAGNLGAGNQPLFVNAALHDYRPAAGSPLINVGDGLGYLNAKLLPVAQPGANPVRKQDWLLDIGAFEY